MPKVFLNLLLKGGANVKKDEAKLSIKSPADQITAPPKENVFRNPKISTSLFTKDLDFESAEPKSVHIQFMAEEELNKISVVNIKQDQKEEDRGNFIGTTADPRMYPHGTSLCSTCGLPKFICPGHLGRIILPVPVMNYWARKYIISVLESICHVCGSMLMNLETAKRFGRSADRLKKIADASIGLPCRNKNCPNQEKANPAFEKKPDNMLKIQMKFDDNKMGYLSSNKIFSLFKSLTEEELEALGFPQNSIYYIHPKNMFFTSLPVLPENHRLTSMVNGKPELNILTKIYHKIIVIVNSIKNGVKNDRTNLETLESVICSIHCRDAETSKNGNPNVIDSSKNINEIIGKKRGIIRSNIQSNRCNHTARTVLTPGGLDTEFGWIRLPEAMNKILVNERICDHNLEYYSKMLDEGKIPFISTRDQVISASKRMASFTLKKGMVVKRPLQTGDPVIFNRNPTLHKHSMMGYIALLGKGLTIGMHSSCCTPHNAD